MNKIISRGPRTTSELLRRKRLVKTVKIIAAILYVLLLVAIVTVMFPAVPWSWQH